MKARVGFMCNSSSSSFIVGFSKVPINEDELRKMMFGDDTYHYARWGDDRYATTEIARAVFKDMQTKAIKDEYGDMPDGEMMLDDILSEMETGYTNGQPDYPRRIWQLEFGTPDYETAMSNYNSLVTRHNTFLRDGVFRPSDKLFKFTYSDNDGEVGSMMEHSGIFDNLRHVRISKH